MISYATSGLKKLSVVMALTGTVILPAQAFQSTGNAIADRFLSGLEADENITIKSYESAEEVSSDIIITNIDLADEEGNSIFVTNSRLKGAEQRTNGDLYIDDLHMSGLRINSDDAAVNIENLEVSKLVILAGDTAKTSLADALYDRLQANKVDIADKQTGDKLHIGMAYAKTNEVRDNMITDSDFGIEKLHLNVNQFDKEQAEVMRKLGYQELDVLVKGHTKWDLETEELIFDRTSLSADEVGTLNMEFKLGGFSKQAIKNLDANKDDESKQFETLQKMTLTNAHLSFEDDSLTGRVLDMQAKEVGTDRKAFISQMKFALPMMLSMLENKSFEKQIKDALLTFMSDPQKLTIKAEPDAPVSFLELITMGLMAPTKLPQMLNANVSAND